MTTEEQLAQINQRISQNQTKRARAQVEEENATEALTTAKTHMKEEFGVATNDDAKALRAKLETDLQAEIQALEAALSEAQDDE